MRIAHLANMYGPKSGGLRTTVDRLALEYSKLGHQVLVITPGTTSSEVNTNAIKKISIKSPLLPGSGGYRVILNLRAVRRALESFSPHVIEVSDRTTLLILLPWAKRKGFLVALFAHERLHEVGEIFFPFIPGKSQLLRKWNSWSRAHVDRLIATTAFAAQEFKELGEVKVVPLGVDHEVFHRRERFHDYLMMPAGPYLFACTRLSKEKDPGFLLDVAIELKSRNIDLPIVIAGSGPLSRDLGAAIREKLLDVRMIGFIGERETLVHYMGRASVFLAPGPIETFGLAALESLAVGTPVICRSSGAISELIDEGCGRALLRDARVWVDEIDNLLAMDRNLLAQLATKRAQCFTWQKTATSLAQMYQENLELPGSIEVA